MYANNRTPPPSALIVAALEERGYVELAPSGRFRRFELPGDGQCRLVDQRGDVLAGHSPLTARRLDARWRAELLREGRAAMGARQ